MSTILSKEKIKTAAILVLGFLLLIVLLTRDSGTKQSDTPFLPATDGEKIHILHYSSNHNYAFTQELTETFNALSATTVVGVEYIDNDSYDDAIRAMFASGTPAGDCLYLRQPGQSNEHSGQGYLLDLTDFVASSGLDVASYGSTLDIVKQQGKIYSIPRVRTAWMLFYNKRYFDEAGMSYPGQLTWEEYAELASALTHFEGEKKVWGGYLPTWTMNLGASTAQEYLTDDELPLTYRYIELLDRLYNVDKSHPDIERMNSGEIDAYHFFTYENAAMTVNGDWTIFLINELQEQGEGLSLDWDIAPLPVFDEVPVNSTVGGCSYLAIPASSQHPDNAFEFIEFNCGEMGASILAKHANCPAYFTPEAAQLYIAETGHSSAVYFFEAFLANEEGNHPLYRDVNELFKSQILSFLNGEQSIDTAFELFYQDRESLLN